MIQALKNFFRSPDSELGGGGAEKPDPNNKLLPGHAVPPTIHVPPKPDLSFLEADDDDPEGASKKIEVPPEWAGKLPKDLTRAIGLVREVREEYRLLRERFTNIRGNDRPSRDDVLRARKIVDFVEKHAYSLQHPPGSKLVEARPFAHFANPTRADFRKQRLAVVNDFLARPIAYRIEFPNVNEQPNSDNIRERLLSESDVQVAYTMLRGFLLMHFKLKATTYADCHPREVAEEIQAALLGVRDLEQAKKLKADLAQCMSPAAERVSSNARASVHADFMALKPYVDELRDTCKNWLTLWRAAAIESERQFFSYYGLPREATSVIRMFDAVLRDLEKLPMVVDDRISFFDAQDPAYGLALAPLAEESPVEAPAKS
jgi:hypothetical protein